MSAPRIRRVTSDSLAGRKLAARSTRIVEGPGPTAEQRAWNDRVDAERRAKKEKKQGFRGPFSLTLSK